MIKQRRNEQTKESSMILLFFSSARCLLLRRNSSNMAADDAVRSGSLQTLENRAELLNPPPGFAGLLQTYVMPRSNKTKRGRHTMPTAATNT